MPIRHAIWKVSANPEQLVSTQLANEQLLEEMIASKPEILHPDWMLIGRQVNTAAGGRIDLLAIQPDGSLVIIELKRNRTPRDVVAQAIDYASWVGRLRSEEIASIYMQFRNGRSLSVDFKHRVSRELDEENLNQFHQIVVVAAALDDSTERIISYLNERDINALFFQIICLDEQQLLSRAWLLDPASTQVKSTTTPDDVKEPWNGEFYASFGHGSTRSWQEAVTYGFISAGGGSWYSNTLKLLQANDLIWVKAPGYGFVGVGKVVGASEPASSFKIKTPDGEVPALQVLNKGSYHREFESDPEQSEYFVPVRWLQTVPITQAVNEIGLFGNQNTVCKPTTPKWRYTVDRLKTQFPNWNA